MMELLCLMRKRIQIGQVVRVVDHRHDHGVRSTVMLGWWTTEGTYDMCDPDHE